MPSLLDVDELCHSRYSLPYADNTQTISAKETGQQGYSSESIVESYGPETQPAAKDYVQSQLHKVGSQNQQFSECTPAQHFRSFMSEKFRELDAEFQRIMHSQDTSSTRNQRVSASCYQQQQALPKSFESENDRGDGPVTEVCKVTSRSDSTPLEVSEVLVAREPSVILDSSPSVAFGPQDSDVTTKIRTSQFSNASVHKAEVAPEDAFVINVRRLIDIQEQLFLLHELVKSTAIAAITLSAAGTASQMLGTSIFLPVVFTLFWMHERCWDRLEVEDIKTLLPLLCDDTGPDYSGANPNRLFKGVTVETSRFASRLFHIFQVIVTIGLALAWLIIEYKWTDPPSRRLGTMDGFRQRLADRYLVTEEDVMALGVQVAVATLMFFLSGAFEYILWRETSAVMPRTVSNEAWDPRRHGTPAKYWLFGMPSMWFTSEAALEKLKKYIGSASAKSETVTQIYPQELAYYALSGDEERAELQTSLSRCKLFDRRSQSFVFDGENPEELALGLYFFDDKLQHEHYPFRGGFMTFQNDEDLPGSAVSASGHDGTGSHHSRMCRISSFSQ